MFGWIQHENNNIAILLFDLHRQKIFQKLTLSKSDVGSLDPSEIQQLFTEANGKH